MGSRQSYQVDGTRWMKHNQGTQNYRYNNFISWYLRSTSRNSPKYIDGTKLKTEANTRETWEQLRTSS